MLQPFKELEVIRKLVNKSKKYVVCIFCNKPILRSQMVNHMSIHKEI